LLRRLSHPHRPFWTWATPLAGWLFLAGAGIGGLFALVLAVGLAGTVLAAVHHAEVVAHRVGEPFGTLVLAVAVTVIEVALVVSLMVAGGDEAAALARDTIFAAVMIILNGIVGLCVLVGGLRHREQAFGVHGVSASLAALAALCVLTLVLPNHTTSAPGPFYSRGQLAFVSAVSVALYATFVLVQTVRHRDYFLPSGAVQDESVHAARPSGAVAGVAGALLLVALGAVVLLAKSLAPVVERAMAAVGAPQAAVGVVIAGLVLLPEGVAAVRAARANRLQTSLNLALGSAMASIALTIPSVALVSLVTGRRLLLGLEGKETVLLALSLFVAALSLSTGRTTVLQGTVQLGILAVYLLTAIVV
jgi:Ca2+:H+ antiporter